MQISLQNPDRTAAAADDPEHHRFPPLLRRCWFGLNQQFRRRIAPVGLTPDQFTTLRWLAENDPAGMTQRDLGRLMSSDPNTITSILKRMEAAGLVRRSPHPEDRRANCIRITETGCELLARARAHARALQDAALSAIPPEKREEFLEHLDRVARTIEALES